jgi:hypothetical protein
VINVTGHPNGNRNFDSMSGATPVINSMEEVEFSMAGLELGLQLAV